MQSVNAPFRVVFIETRMAGLRLKAGRSGGELLATARAAGSDNLAAADRRHAGAEAVAALAHDLAGLKGPLHRCGLRIPIVGEKVERRPISNAQTPAQPLG
jgi:hypothetical protein